MSLTLACSDDAVDAIVVHAGLEAITVSREAVQRKHDVVVKVARRRLLKVVPEAVQT